MVGKQRYKTGDYSRNSFWLALLTWGEGWHNNHHYYPNTARQGFFWWEIDLTFYILKLMEVLGIVHDLKGVPAHIKNPSPSMESVVKEGVLKAQEAAMQPKRSAKISKETLV